MSTWRIAFTISFLVHALLFLSLSKGGGEGGEEGGEGNKEGLVDFTPVIIEKPESGGRGDPCDDWYGGIGVTGWDRVDRVYKGYPAHRAGMKSGDLITSNFFAIKGKPGTPVTVTVLRDGKTLTFNMIREKICTNGE